jgi:hypothetical protein
MMTPAAKGSQSLEDEIAQLRGLDLDGLQARWHSVIGRHAPPHLPKHLLLRILAYRLQVVALGNLDRATIRLLEKLAGGGGSRQNKAPSVPLPGEGAVKSGTLLMREWNGVQYRVMALDEGFAWNGRTYRSLSEVARAITGTRWSGPRFFGTRQPTASDPRR